MRFLFYLIVVSLLAAIHAALVDNTAAIDAQTEAVTSYCCAVEELKPI